MLDTLCTIVHTLSTSINKVTPRTIDGQVEKIMGTPSEKAPAMENFLEEVFGRTTSIEGNKCIPAPFK